MAELSSIPAIPGMSPGILHPQLPHRFAVYFRADYGDGSFNTKIVELMKVLTCQLTSVQLPELQLGGYAGARPVGAFGVRRHAGNVKFTFEEDVTGFVSAALEGLTDGSVSWLGATVCKLDGNETVLEAFDLRDVRFLSVQHSTLTYYGHGASARGTITDSRPDDKGYPLFTANVNLGLSDGSSACATQTITATAELILAARYPGGKALNEVLGDL